MNRRIGILGGLAALVPLVVEGKRKRQAQAESLCGCMLTFAYYGSDFTPGSEDVSVVTGGNPTVTMPDPALHAGRELKVVGQGNQLMALRDFSGVLLCQRPAVLVCDGTNWYVAAAF